MKIHKIRGALAAFRSLNNLLIESKHFIPVQGVFPTEHYRDIEANCMSGASVTWDPENKDEYPNNFKLIIKQILLAHEAKENEFNVVEVEAMSLRDPIKIPIAVLKVGETRSVRTDLEFPDAPVTFKLIEGNGPVHIHGQHSPGAVVEEIEDYGEEMEEEILDEEDADEEDDDEANPKKKIKLSNNAKGGGAKVAVPNAKNSKKK